MPLSDFAGTNKLLSLISTTILPKHVNLVNKQRTENLNIVSGSNAVFRSYR